MSALPKDWTIGVGAPGLGKPLPTDLATHRHLLRITQDWPDGYGETTEVERDGEARACHERLAKRWKDAGFDFERDRKSLTLTKHHPIGELTYIQIVQHVAVEE